MKTVLIIDDNRLDRLIHRRWLEGLCPGEFRILESESANGGLMLAQRESIDCVLLDYVMLREDGLQAIQLFRSEIADCPPIILMSCALTDDMRRNAMALGAVACLLKPIATGDELLAAVQSAIDDRAIEPVFGVDS